MFCLLTRNNLLVCKGKLIYAESYKILIWMNKTIKPFINLLKRKEYSLAGEMEEEGGGGGRVCGEEEWSLDLQCMGTFHYVSGIFTKDNFFHNFLFAVLADQALPKWG